MFTGEYSHTIDNKKRLSIPANFRTELGDKAVITKGLDNCLFLYPQSEWEEIAQELSNLPFAQSDARSLARFMLAGAMEVELDKVGRILIPDYLKEYASLEKKVVIAGLYDRIEIWDKEQWEEYKSKTEQKAGDIAERLKEFGV